VRDSGIKEIIKSLNNFDFEEKSLLDVFARDGSWQTKAISKLVKITHAWEVDETFRESLIDNLPEGTIVKIGDSHELIQIEKEKFDIVVFDNPMNCYGEFLEYCEHFDIIQNFRLIAKDDVVVIYNVKSEPFDYDQNPNWQKRRNEFYKLEDTSSLSIGFLRGFYEDLFSKLGYKTQKVIVAKRPQETGLYQFASILERK
tara:strand:+ start:1669 stop:2268 length:600 start_codon:yes stop_codon:yes gene_type:complete